jgi:fucose permease
MRQRSRPSGPAPRTRYRPVIGTGVFARVSSGKSSAKTSLKRIDTYLSAGTLPRGLLPAIAAGLVAIGIFFGMGGPLWPDVLDSFDVSKSQFGLLSGLSLALSFPVLLFGGRLTDQFGKSAVLFVSMLVLVFVSFGFATASGGLLVFAILLAVRGLGVALVDLSANTLTIDAETATGKHLMGPLHATFSAGSILGAGAVAVALALDFDFRDVYGFLAVALFLLALVVLPIRSMDRERQRGDVVHVQRFRVAFKSPTIRLCALLTGLSFAGEIIVADWTSLYLREDRGLSGSYAAACIVAFGIAMLIGRMTNGSMIRIVGVSRATMVQGLVAAAGGVLIVLEFSDDTPMIGCALAGLGLAGIGPTALSVAGITLPADAGSAAGMTLAGGYIGLAGAPVASGLIADALSTRTTLAMVAVVGVVVVIVARALPEKRY